MLSYQVNTANLMENMEYICAEDQITPKILSGCLSKFILCRHFQNLLVLSDRQADYMKTDSDMKKGNYTYITYTHMP